MMRAQAARVPAEGGHLGKGPGRAALRFGSSKGGSTAPTRGAGSADISLALPRPPPTPESRSPTARRRGTGGGKRAGGKEGVGRLSYLVLRRELGGLGGLGRGKGSGEGAGKGGSPCEV